jgi:hypothetical protein
MAPLLRSWHTADACAFVYSRIRSLRWHQNVSRFARLLILFGKVQSHGSQRQPRIQAIRRLAS